MAQEALNFKFLTLIFQQYFSMLKIVLLEIYHLNFRFKNYLLNIPLNEDTESLFQLNLN